MLFIIAPIAGYILMLIALFSLDDWKFHLSNFFMSFLGAIAGFLAVLICWGSFCHFAERTVEKTEEQSTYVMYQEEYRNI